MKNMTQNTNSIKGGVIIMGSLFWENEKNCVEGKEIEGKVRREWRELNLKTETQSIRVPTRYGRFSGKKNRKETYTMVLSREYLERLGTALVVPFKELFSLTEEAEKEKITSQLKELSKVEGIFESPNNLLAKDWSAISIWINPNSSYHDEIKTYWQTDIITNSINGYANKNYEWSDGTLLDKNFQLQLPIASDFDFLLCTYMLPRYERGDVDSDRQKNLSKGYPTAQMIGEAISTSNPPYVTYFAENRVNGITTSDDEEIFKHIPKIY
jgi:hypothetical protein